MEKYFIEIITKMGYENILDFLECIDLDGDRGTEDLESIKDKLREFLHNNQ